MNRLSWVTVSLLTPLSRGTGGTKVYLVYIFAAHILDCKPKTLFGLDSYPYS